VEEIKRESLEKGRGRGEELNDENLNLGRLLQCQDRELEALKELLRGRDREVQLKIVEIERLLGDCSEGQLGKIDNSMPLQKILKQGCLSNDQRSQLLSIAHVLKHQIPRLILIKILPKYLQINDLTLALTQSHLQNHKSTEFIIPHLTGP
jgi:hypothetical protein